MARSFSPPSYPPVLREEATLPDLPDQTQTSPSPGPSSLASVILLHLSLSARSLAVQLLSSPLLLSVCTAPSSSLDFASPSFIYSGCFDLGCSPFHSLPLEYIPSSVLLPSPLSTPTSRILGRPTDRATLQEPPHPFSLPPQRKPSRNYAVLPRRDRPSAESGSSL